MRVPALAGLLVVLVLACLGTAGPAGAATFVVTNTNNAGAGSLRAAILAANAVNDTDVIKFALPGAPPYLINLTTKLPQITFPVVINGETQAGYAGQPLIQVSNKTSSPFTGFGFEILGGASKVMGLDIVGWGAAIRLANGDGNTIQGNWLGEPLVTPPSGNGTGVLIEGGSANNVVGGSSGATTRNVIGFDGLGVAIKGTGTSGNLVQGNYIGTTHTGAGNGENSTGVFISAGATGNTIGGTGPATRNIIAASSVQVSIRGVGTSGNVVRDNYVCLDINGNGGISGDETDGVAIGAGATGNTVGGLTASARNVISGCGTAGVRLTDPGTNGNLVQGNWIGTDLTGTAARPQTFGVIVSNGAKQNTIGGTVAGARNVVSGNAARGVWIQLAGTKNNVVAGNWVGLDAAGQSPLPNGLDGITVSVGAAQNTVGGTTAGARNVVSGNQSFNVHIADAGTTGNVVQGNYIGTNVAGSAALVAAASTSGIQIENGATGNDVGGTVAGARNVISGNGGPGVSILSDGNSVEGNYIGTDATGAQAISNNVGVSIAGSHNTVGGTVAGARNLISSNDSAEVVLTSPGGANLVAGNYIGTNATGNAGFALAAQAYGVHISGSPGNTIGGTTDVARNVIAAEPTAGVLVELGTADHNLVRGNWIGLGAGGSALGNGVGVQISGGAVQETVGGTVAGAANVISGNQGAGVLLSGTGTQSNLVQGNLIGTDPGGTVARPNGGPGVSLDAAASVNTIGGTSATAGNTIWFNVGDGVLVDGTVDPIASDTIERNSIWSNGGLGINLVNGANNDEPAPVIDSATTAAGTTQVKVSLGSNVAIFRIELFVSPTCDASGAGEGKMFLATRNVDTNQSSSTTFSVPALSAGQALTATTTDLNNGNTSEFSTCFTTP